jgi:hypothetical protein
MENSKKKLIKQHLVLRDYFTTTKFSPRNRDSSITIPEFIPRISGIYTINIFGFLRKIREF